MSCFKELLSNRESVDDLVSYVCTNRTPQVSTVKKLIHDFNGIYSLSDSFHKWLVLQAQPFLNLRTSFSSSSTHEPNVNSGLKDVLRNETVVSTLSISSISPILNSTSASEAFKTKLEKQKKRMTPSIVSSIPTSCSFGNISSLQDSPLTKIESSDKILKAFDLPINSSWHSPNNSAIRSKLSNMTPRPKKDDPLGNYRLAINLLVVQI